MTIESVPATILSGFPVCIRTNLNGYSPPFRNDLHLLHFDVQGEWAAPVPDKKKGPDSGGDLALHIAETALSCL